MAMQIITESELNLRKGEIKKQILNGAVFIHPTDTIYGIGCDATSSKAVKKVRDLKGRPTTPFSVIAPSKDWIRANCIVDKKGEKWLKKLPGPYTLIFKTKQQCVAPEVNPGVDTLGVRIPKHWFAKFVEELNIPIVTTSANIAGNPFMTSIDDLDEKLKQGLDFAIYEGEKKGYPSTIVHLEEKRKLLKFIPLPAKKIKRKK